MPVPPRMEYEAALRQLLRDPAYQGLMFDSYIEEDVRAAAARFGSSAEWRAVVGLLGGRIRGATVLDLGAGNGVASLAFAHAGATRVLAIEPHPGSLAGRGAIDALGDPRITVIDAKGEALPLPTGSVDIVYGRQVLHHASDLPGLVRESARVLRAGGIALFTREHVVDGPAQLAEFLAAHPVHQLAGGENAYPLEAYRSAIVDAPLRLDAVLGPWDSIINAFPTPRTEGELRQMIRADVRERHGRAGRLLARIPLAANTARRRRWSGDPGRLFSFVAVKPRG